MSTTVAKIKAVHLRNLATKAKTREEEMWVIYQNTVMNKTNHSYHSQIAYDNYYKTRAEAKNISDKAKMATKIADEECKNKTLITHY